jgi:hypothetical protein
MKSSKTKLTDGNRGIRAYTHKRRARARPDVKNSAGLKQRSMRKPNPIQTSMNEMSSMKLPDRGYAQM